MAFLVWSVAQERKARYSEAMIEIIDSTPEQPSQEVKKTAEQWAKELSACLLYTSPSPRDA